MATTAAPPAPATAVEAAVAERQLTRLSPGDRITLFVMAAVPTLLVLWSGLAAGASPRWSSASFTAGTASASFDTIKWVGLDNYNDIFTIYPPFWPAIEHNLIWLAVLFLIPTPLGMFLAVLLDQEIRGSRFYQTSLFLPVVLSLALVGFIWQLIYSPRPGPDQRRSPAARPTGTATRTSTCGRCWSPSCWRQTGYVMLLYLAGLKARRPDAARGGGRRRRHETQTFFRVVFPVMRPINIVVLVITVIESLRAFDIVWVVNKGRNGLELISDAGHRRTSSARPAGSASARRSPRSCC